jgi:EAL and modified HD-GYP domain-containing signal transduction protein
VAQSYDAPEPATVRSQAFERVHIGRQALYDRSLNSVAYELFYRAPDGGEVDYADGDLATCSVVLSAFSELGLERVAGGKLVFLDVPHAVIQGEVPLPVPPGRVVLSVRDYEHSPSELLNAFKQRKREGFYLALDDFSYCEATAQLVSLVDYVKLNVKRLGIKGVREQKRLLSNERRRTIACGLDTPEDFSGSVAAGCDLFQGKFLFRPQLIKHKRLPQSFKTVLTLLKKLRDPDVEYSEVERIVKTDAALGVAVLRFLGSAAYGTKHEVKSISQAVGLLGLREFSKWVTVVALAATTERPSELGLVALTRARACELVARNQKSGSSVDPDVAFTVGLFSALGALLECSIEDLLEELPVSPDVREAVLAHAGPTGRILSSVLSREDSDSLRGIVPVASPSLLNEAWLSAVTWAEQAQRSLSYSSEDR